MIKMNIGLDKRLKDAREAKGLSQNYVAEHLNITRQAISKWENGKSMPDLENLIILSTLYEISLDELLGKTPSPEETHEPQEIKLLVWEKKKKRVYKMVVVLCVICLLANIFSSYVILNQIIFRFSTSSIEAL